jgi:hypothetical protein
MRAIEIIFEEGILLTQEESNCHGISQIGSD